VAFGALGAGLGCVAAWFALKIARKADPSSRIEWAKSAAHKEFFDNYDVDAEIAKAIAEDQRRHGKNP
jgi:hypothetical protein